MTNSATEDQEFIGNFTEPLLEMIRKQLDGEGRHAAYWHIRWCKHGDSLQQIGISNEIYLSLFLKRSEMEGYITYERKVKMINGQMVKSHIVGITGPGRQYLTWQEQRVWRFVKDRLGWIILVGLGVSVVGGLITAGILALLQGCAS